MKNTKVRVCFHIAHQSVVNNFRKYSINLKVKNRSAVVCISAMVTLKYRRNFSNFEP